MFTGLIESTGIIKEIGRRGDYRVLSVAASFAGEPLAVGASIACDGTCLTVVSAGEGWFAVEASEETARRTTINRYRVGSKINLERSLKVGDRLGGHFVTGHVDDVGVVDFLRRAGRSLELAIGHDPKYDCLVVEKGSICISGVSLTVNDLRSAWFCVNLIPHTAEVTTIGSLTVGSRVNLEFDMIGKYVLKIKHKNKARAITKDKLLESGW